MAQKTQINPEQIIKLKLGAKQLETECWKVEIKFILYREKSNYFSDNLEK